MLDKNSGDEDLWHAISLDDSKAFSLLLERYWKKVIVTAFKYLKDRDICEQVVQDIFIYLWQKRSRLDIKSFQHYLNSAARYQIYKHLKAVRLSPVIYSDEADLAGNEYCNNKGEDDLLASELIFQINASLDLLPNRCKEIFVLSRQEHLSNAEIADKLNISKRTVENQITHALKHLRTILKYSALTVYIIYLTSL